jgi:hypothetical protein
MPVLGARCGELRIPDEGVTWRIMYRLDPDAVVIAEVFAKKTQATPGDRAGNLPGSTRPVRSDNAGRGLSHAKG